MDIFSDILYYLFTALYAYAAIVVVVMILLENRNPIKTLSWIMIMIILPILGIFLYAFFGQDFRRKKFVHCRQRFLNPLSVNSLDINLLGDTTLNSKTRKLARLLYNSSISDLYSGAKVDVFTDGNNTFKALFADMEQAKEHIHVEFYIIAYDEVGREFLDILSRKAKEGVRVRFVYDYFGGWTLPNHVLKQLRENGAFIQPFLPAYNVFGFRRINYRNHRKLVIIDGKIGYTGGLNVAKRYKYGNELGLWRDTFVRVTGTAVHGLQFLFLNDWNFVDKKGVNDIKYFPNLGEYGSAYMQTVMSGPDTDWKSIMQGIIIAISTAEKLVYIHTPYYLPPESVMTAVETAALAGVDVRIIIPERNDNRLVAAASRSYMQGLLDVGVRVFYYKTNFLHSKAIVIDDEISIVGTANMDMRSYEQNFEVAAFIYDKKTAKTLQEKFLEDIDQSRELNRNLWKHRSKYKKIKESIARLFSPLL